MTLPMGFASDPVHLSILVPGRPPSPNATRRRHWSADSSEVKRVRGDVFRIATDARNRSAFRDGFPIAVAELDVVYQLTAARGDLDNLLAGSKPIIDGLVDAGILRTDSVTCLVEFRIRWRKGTTNVVAIVVRERREA